MSLVVDRAVDEMDAAMVTLRASLRGVPVDTPGFSASYEKARKAVGELLVGLTDVKSKVRDD
ncbi:hypothetical protein GCM10022243_23810 [Saccharothrix violaceirubra]|uniref:Uncharacterized protein n=1 Tax=Saccharothrix violaceirubra TaxID=413306 RepID=A0A7W7T7M7_9PSEU|nr:hypothetical protein [Saccharothrix violaceirubra]MBB4967826.1 hypothetical protein [Saccharothrix violaceirubra]